MFRSILFGIFSIVALSTGCSAQTEWATAPLDHPANPDARVPAFAAAPSALDAADEKPAPSPADAKGEEHQHNHGGAPAKDGEKAGHDHDQHSDAKKAYPLDTCVVSGEKLGEHGKPYVFNYEGREVQLCCKSCLKDFNK